VDLVEAGVEGFGRVEPADDGFLIAREPPLGVLLNCLR
jgi:hypothetical protein